MARKRSTSIFIEDEADAEAEDTNSVQLGDLDDMSRNDLRDALLARGLASTGNKSVLKQRLREVLVQDDRNSDAQPDDEEIIDNDDVDENGDLNDFIDDTGDGSDGLPAYVHLSYCDHTCGDMCNPDGQPAAPPPPYEHVNWCTGACGNICANSTQHPPTGIVTTPPPKSTKAAAAAATARKRQVVPQPNDAVVARWFSNFTETNPTTNKQYTVTSQLECIDVCSLCLCHRGRSLKSTKRTIVTSNTSVS